VDADLLVRKDDDGLICLSVENMRDGANGAELYSRLEAVEVGRDDHGDLIFSCVVVPVDGPQVPKKRTRPLSGPQSIALQQLTNAINTVGTLPPSSPHIPPQVHCVDEAIWRNYCYCGGISTGDRKAQEKAFSRAATALLEANRIGRWNEWVWVVPQ
jgi:hypothetical protein